MKTSNFTAVEGIIKEIRDINTKLKYLKECTVFSVVTAQGQIRLSVTQSQSANLHAKMEDVLHTYFTDIKTALIGRLQQSYGVEYDGD